MFVQNKLLMLEAWLVGRRLSSWWPAFKPPGMGRIASANVLSKAMLANTSSICE